MDDRPLKLIAKTPVPEDHIQVLSDIAQWCNDAAQAGGKDLQFEFGKEHVAFIIGCNQFVRIYRNGDHAGQVEIWLEEEPQKTLETAGTKLLPAVGGAIFQMFGWKTLNPLAAGPELRGAVDSAASRAINTKATM